MHLAIDIREACRPKRTGKGQWTYGFVEELLSRNIQLTLFTDVEIPAKWKKLIDDAHNHTRIRVISARGLWWHLAVAKEVKKDASIDVYVSTVSYIVPCLLGKSKHVVPIVHDLIAFQNEPHDRRAVFIEKLTLKRAMKSAYAVCTISETTKQDLLSHVCIQSECVIPIFAASNDHTELRHVADDIVLCMGTLCPRKNQKRLIEAHALLPQELRARYPLILIGGRGWHDEEIVQLATQTPHVEWKSYVTEEERTSFLARAVLLAFPSLYEGFGLPIIEAMKCNVPVLTSNIGSTKEVAGDAALLVEPTSTDSIRNGLLQMLTQADMRKDLQARGLQRAQHFTWSKTVDIFLATLTKFDRTEK